MSKYPVADAPATDKLVNDLIKAVDLYETERKNHDEFPISLFEALKGAILYSEVIPVTAAHANLMIAWAQHVPEDNWSDADAEAIEAVGDALSQPWEPDDSE